MPVYPTAITARTEPLDVPERTPCDWMDECAHSSAYRMQFERFEGAFDDERFGALDELARLLGCADCDEWEE